MKGRPLMQHYLLGTPYVKRKPDWLSLAGHDVSIGPRHRPEEKQGMEAKEGSNGWGRITLEDSFTRITLKKRRSKKGAIRETHTTSQ